MFRTKKYCQQLRISKRNISTTAPTFLAEAVFACYSDYYEGNPQNVFVVSQWSSKDRSKYIARRF